MLVLLSSDAPLEYQLTVLAADAHGMLVTQLRNLAQDQVVAADLYLLAAAA